MVDVHAIHFFLRTTVYISIGFETPEIRSRSAEWELTSSHGYMYIPLRKPWNSRPFSVWFLGTGTGTIPLLSQLEHECLYRIVGKRKEADQLTRSSPYCRWMEFRLIAIQAPDPSRQFCNFVRIDKGAERSQPPELTMPTAGPLSM